MEAIYTFGGMRKTVKVINKSDNGYYTIELPSKEKIYVHNTYITII